MREYHYEIKYVQGKYNYVADQLSRPVRVVQRCPTTTIRSHLRGIYKMPERRSKVERNY